MLIRRIVRFIITLLFGGLGFYLDYLMVNFFDIEILNNVLGFSIRLFWTYIISSVLFAVIGFLIAPFCVNFFLNMVKRLETLLTKMPSNDLIGAFIGVIAGLLIASLFSSSFSGIPFLGPIFSVLLSVFLAYVGFIIGIKRKEELFGFLNFIPKRKGEKAEKGEKGEKSKEVLAQNDHVLYKILDTSVIIDGRISDIVRTGFIDGILLVPNFVLEELRHIADSSDALKRNRGRRGLDILNQISKEAAIQVEIYEGDSFDDLAEVDSKLVRLGQILNSPVLTNDYNLNKVAELQGVKVLNINELANAIKPVVLPGEEMYVQVMKEGKEPGQGVAYLDDGTMVVVDGGKKHIGQETTVLVTTVLQTAAGRMIFAKPKELMDRSIEEYSEVNVLG
ncbi:PilT protein domain protein [Syntrophobotulus glycolicus DSM 8271]|uniref:PilT protein domain protein n=1 Tax=Syntrophobotulus glycolicus (strain DSM 8271 / FlGlyR) TaxID=645991 RepID=F0SWX6_SYNGF|nr:PilT protein domain protein [Syntrophobotulus glycolicus DSM 8271]